MMIRGVVSVETLKPIEDGEYISVQEEYPRKWRNRGRRKWDCGADCKDWKSKHGEDHRPRKAPPLVEPEYLSRNFPGNEGHGALVNLSQDFQARSTFVSGARNGITEEETIKR